MGKRFQRGLIGHAFVCVLLFSLAAAAGSVYLNGQNIDTVRDQRMQNVNVYIDGQGNVHIDAPAYRVLEETPSAPPAVPQPGPNPALANRYFLVTEQTRIGAVQYDVELYINGLLVRRIGSDEPQLISEMSSALRPGPNQVRIKATKNLQQGRRSYSAQDVFRLIIGQGQPTGQQVTITQSIVVFSLTAADVMPADRAYALNAN